MRIVLINQFYPPDLAPTGQMLETVAQVLVEQGHQVTVLCSKGGYGKSEGGDFEAIDPPKDSLANPRILRVGGFGLGRIAKVAKIVDYLAFLVFGTVRLLLLRPRPHRVVVLSTPPFLSVYARGVSKLIGADHGHWIMDVYPDVIRAHGMLEGDARLYRFLETLMRWGLHGRRCAMVHTLSEDMADTLGGYVQDGRPVSWTPLWNTDSGAEDWAVELSQVTRLRRDRGWGEAETVFLYSGNMGLGHRFEEIFEVIRRRGAELASARVAFFGQGPRRGAIDAFAKESHAIPVEAHGYAPHGVLGAHLRSGDVHFVSLDPQWSALMAPSKLQGVFAAGRPVIFIGAEASSMARWVLDAGAGWVVAPGDVEGLLRAMREAMDATVQARCGMAARQFAIQRFSRENNTSEVARRIVA